MKINNITRKTLIKDVHVLMSFFRTYPFDVYNYVDNMYININLNINIKS